MKKVAITGASGFLGKFVVPILIERGYAVHPLKINMDIPEKHLAQLKELQPEWLIHLAWETTPALFWHSEANIRWLQLSLDLITTFAQHGGKRLFITGSCAESQPTTLYGACKASLRLCAQNVLPRRGVSFVWGQLFFPYGPYEKGERLIPTLINTLLMGKPFTCTSAGHLRDFLYIEDVAMACVESLESAVEGSVEIGLGQPIAVGDLVQLVAEKMGASSLVRLSSSPDTPDNPRRLIADAEKLRDEVRFRPKYTLEQGLQNTINWWQNHDRNRP